MDQVSELVKLGCVGGIHLHISALHAARARRQCRLRALPDHVQLHVAPAVHQAPISHLMMNLAENVSVNADLQEAIIVAPHNWSKMTIDWLDARQIPGRFYPVLNYLSLAEIAEVNSKKVDRAAKSSLRSLRRRHGKSGWYKEVALSEWSDRFWARLGGPPDRAHRRAMLGTAQFKTYVMLLGMTPLSGKVHFSQVPRRRPVRQDLISIYDNLMCEHGRCLFLHWCNRLLQQFPTLQSSFVRKMLFGSSNMERIAHSVGLIRKKQRLHLAISFASSALRNVSNGYRHHRQSAQS